jgi:hypothetical protein
MIRTQVYLPQDLYAELQSRSADEGVPMAEHIREALRRYLAEPAGGVLGPDDPLWTLVGAGEGPVDGSAEHDRDLYDHSSDE